MAQAFSRFSQRCARIHRTYHPFSPLRRFRDAEYFHQPSRSSQEPSDNWVLRFNAVKRVYRLITQYFSDVLGQPTDALEVPDLQAVAKDYNIPSTLMMCRLTLAIAVQCDKNKEFIEKIQGLSEANQHHLMKAIEQVQRNPSNLEIHP
jgi:protein HOOK3